VRNFVAVGSWVSNLWGVKIRHLPLTWLVAVNTVLALPRSLWLDNENIGGHLTPLQLFMIIMQKLAELEA